MKAKMMKTEWWRPENHADRRAILLRRNSIQAGIRGILAAQDFIEVDPSALAISPGNEAHLHGFRTDAIGNDGKSRTLYLHTSPEFAMKKLLAAGETRIFSFAHVWRNKERGPLHSPEFTMLEWYRVAEDYTVLMDDVMAFLRLAAGGSARLGFRDKTCDLMLDPERLTVADAFHRYAGVDLMASIDATGAVSATILRDELTRIGVRTAEDDTWSDMLSRVLGERVEPHLGAGRVTILDEYPAAEAALARRKPGDPRVAERFEVYACGVELANGFGELTDPVEQRHRFGMEMDEKERVYGERYPLDDDLLQALALVPASCGIAMGFDRVVMLATGAARIDDVLWAPVPI